MGALPKRYFTAEEYLLLEERAPYKSQFINGEIFPMGEDTTSPPSMMGGAQPDHVRVTGNIVINLGGQFRGRSCHVFSSDLRIAIKPGSVYMYPDVVALCGEPRFETERKPASLLNPQVIFEVLSPSTEDFDRGNKFDFYRRVESVSDYILVSVDRMHVERRERRADGWSMAFYDRPTERLNLAGLAAELLLADIYDKVDLPTAGGPASSRQLGT